MVAGPDKYATIVADPPWDHGEGTGLSQTRGMKADVRREESERGNTKPPYPMMPLAEIMALPVAALAAPDAHLYLWVTNKYLRQVWDVAEAWGFSGVCLLTWCKAPLPAPLGGAYRNNTEFCLFARRGSLKAVGYSESRWFQWPRRKGPPVKLGQKRQTMHSAKPEAFLDLVETISPGPYLEMFARRNRLGWDTWGNESLEHVAL